MVQGDFPLKFESKTLKHPLPISPKNLKPFKHYILKIQGNTHLLIGLNTGQNTQKNFLEQILYSILIENCFKN